MSAAIIVLLAYVAVGAVMGLVLVCWLWAESRRPWRALNALLVIGFFAVVWPLAVLGHREDRR